MPNPNSDLYIRQPSAWNQVVNTPYFRWTGLWYAVKQLWRCRHFVPPGETETVQEWNLITDWSVPTSNVPGASLGKVPANNLRGRVSWTAVATGPEAAYTVVVAWYRNGSLFEYTSAHQSVGASDTSIDYDEFDSVEADVFYRAGGGDGPATRLGPIVLGP